MSSIEARLNIEVLVDCPNCDYLINLLDISDTDGSDLNDDGHILKQACPDGYWMDKHEKFEVNNVVCSQCKHGFHVKGLEW